MSRTCQVTGARPRTGMNVPHSQQRTKRWFRVNVQRKRFYVPSERRWIRITLSAKGQKIIDVRGIDRVYREMVARGERF
ncbi:50S ribosomal protein L28 [Patulibacter minatonensis]|jgi:large subunit ribosomal protein L28|uniref:50S ribosomal protein L28 n=1 Tax=Patulibacter minatonensis TaxID=298163 RepID=UPI00047ED337|nr:50S ribosomal protein L28 [Patulibacter minatonensis]